MANTNAKICISTNCKNNIHNTKKYCDDCSRLRKIAQNKNSVDKRNNYFNSLDSKTKLDVMQEYMINNIRQMRGINYG